MSEDHLERLERIFEVKYDEDSISEDVVDVSSSSSSLCRVRTLLNRASEREHITIDQRLQLIRSSPFRSYSSTNLKGTTKTDSEEEKKEEEKDSVLQFGLYTFVEMIETLSEAGSRSECVELLQDLVEFLTRRSQHHKHLIKNSNKKQNALRTSEALDKTRNFLASLCEYEEATTGLVALAVLRESLHDLLVSVMTLLNSKSKSTSSLNTFMRFLRPITNQKRLSSESSNLVTSDVFTCGQNAYDYFRSLYSIEISLITYLNSTLALELTYACIQILRVGTW